MPTLAAGVAGCSYGPLSDSGYYLRQAFTGGDDLPLSKERILAIPYASIGVRIARSPLAFVLLASQKGRTLQWVSADRHLIETCNGRITRTVGFDHDIGDTIWSRPDPLGQTLDPGQTYQASRTIDIKDSSNPLMPSAQSPLYVQSTLSYEGDETLQILDYPIPTRRWREEVAAVDGDWRATNHFWIGVNHDMVWKSRQYIAPEMDSIDIITLRPAIMPKS